MATKALPLVSLLFVFIRSDMLHAQTTNRDSIEVKAEHGGINLENKSGKFQHTLNPEAQWFPDAGLGLFLHWGISSVKAINISWSMIPGGKLASMKFDEKEKARIFRERDYNLEGKVPWPTPNQYFEFAKDFNPDSYDPDKWIKASKDAGFTYAVLTTRHHEGFALWPSDYGNFNTKNFMGGRDLVAPFVTACRKYGLKVGLYYSPPDWHFEKDYKNFMQFNTVAAHPDFPSIDADLNPRAPGRPDPEKLKAFQKEYAAMVRGQVQELLTRYGKIDLLWFDGKPPIPDGDKCITAAEILKIQPGIVINPRLHGTGDFKTFERVIPEKRSADDTDWAEFCNTWTYSWAYYQDGEFRDNGFILGQLAKCRAMGINYLLGIGPMANGKLEENAYKNMRELQSWMEKNKSAIEGVQRLPAGEESSVPATASGNKRYLYLIPEFKGEPYAKNKLPPNDVSISYQTSAECKSAKLLASGEALAHDDAHGKLTVRVPAAQRSSLVDVIELTF